jgi:ribosomal protein S18 acetylase RimI-like enzyme
MNAPALRFRLASTDDAAALGEFMTRNFVAAYGHTASPENIAAAIARNYGESAQRRQLAADHHLALVAEYGQELAAHALLGLAGLPSTGVVPLPTTEVARFYVDAQFHGRGVAQATMAEVKRTALQRGAASLWLSVAQTATQAIRFYEKEGFRISGELVYLLGDDPKDDWLMVCDLAA